jgi:hypothetical protein
LISTGYKKVGADDTPCSFEFDRREGKADVQRCLWKALWRVAIHVNNSIEACQQATSYSQGIGSLRGNSAWVFASVFQPVLAAALNQDPPQQ